MFPRLLALSGYHIVGCDIFKPAPGQIQTMREGFRRKKTVGAWILLPLHVHQLGYYSHRREATDCSGLFSTAVLSLSSFTFSL